MTEGWDARPLELCLRALWGEPFEIRFVDGTSLARAAFRERSLRLPNSESSLLVAQATHAALHAELSPLPFEAGRLAPVQRAILGVLEDARVESLALVRFPGLRAIWAPFHTASPEDGESAPALLGRLARALFDRGYGDRNAWVQRATAAFETRGRAVDAVRELASSFGNELGQMRLPFNIDSPTNEPRYRDDHSGLWRSEPQPAHDSPHAADDARRSRNAAGLASACAPDDGELPITARYAEWDHAIGVERRDHCAIRERRAGAMTPVEVPVAVQRRTRAALNRAHRLERKRPRCSDGQELDLNAVVTEAARRARGEGGDGRLYRGSVRRASRSSTLLLLDFSASMTERDVALLQQISVLLGRSMPAGAELAIDGFSSCGRDDVRYERFKSFDEPHSGLVPVRSRSGSTRLGAALRHATELLCARRAARRVLFVVSDGEPADVDVFDPRYLQEDARRAVQDAHRRGIRVFACCLGERLGPTERQVFQRPFALGAAALRRPEQLPGILVRAYSPRRSGRGGESRG